MRVLVYEHVSGGGFASEPLPTSVLCEGYAMLRSVVSDFKAAGHEVTITLDSRIATLKPPMTADIILPISPEKDIRHALSDSSKQADASLIIAPESDGTLELMVEIVESSSAVSLNSKSNAIREITNKMALSRRTKELGLFAPETVSINSREEIVAAKKIILDKLKLPIVIKPVCGVSCGGISLVTKIDQLSAAIKKTSLESSNPHFLAQEFIEGEAVSVSLIAAEGEALPLSLNKQNVTLGTSESISKYEGGFVTLDSPLKAEAFAAAEKTVTSFEGLSGYIGVDMVLTEKEPVVIEVNPRLTTSFVGLRKLSKINLSQAMLNAAINCRLPNHFRIGGYSYFSKVAIKNPSNDMFRRFSQMENVAAPPFPLGQNGTTHALVQAQGDTFEKVVFGLNETKKQLQTEETRGAPRW